jgi:hypothetical protein
MDISTYTYTHECPRCDSEWEERRFTPYQRPQFKKVCPNCLTRGDTRVEDLGGLSDTRRCGNCEHFQPLDTDKHPWGACGLGHELETEPEYTLTWAIDNVTGCLVSFDEHEEYGDDVEGLVHYFDRCGDFEKDGS